MKTIQVKESQLEAMEKLGIQYEEVEDEPKVEQWTPSEKGAYSIAGDGTILPERLRKFYLKVGNVYQSKTNATRDIDLFKRQSLIRAYDREFGVEGEARCFTIRRSKVERQWSCGFPRIDSIVGEVIMRDPQIYYLGQSASEKLVNDLNKGIVALPGMECK